MKHFTTPEFWETYEKLPKSAQLVADKNYKLLKENPSHPSLYYKKVKEFRSVRVGIHHRALGVENGGDTIWFWIGTHAEYDKLIS